jgi:hypothetical protein
VIWFSYRSSWRAAARKGRKRAARTGRGGRKDGEAGGADAVGLGYGGYV